MGEILEEVEVSVTETKDAIESWMNGVELQIVHHKTKVLLVRNCKVAQRMQIDVSGHVIASKHALKQLGVIIDKRLSFNNHVDYACENSAKATNAIARIMPIVGGSRSSTRRLLSIVSSSMLRYGVLAWNVALKTKRNRVKLNMTFRLMALRVASAYKTITSEAVCVVTLSSFPPPE
ncbi:uncharacterized protein LOC131679648 [Topomyia yanbarensis]|uniref:uncharacterized protein LOC131679648 n=1 Tax=Topomyia yanbarensis TaxID=2498891 RepID=UPI00273CA2DF|nr:uncharacterized protein LOC131679648 [Topomyia yanbarensis]